MSRQLDAVVFDIGNVLIQWDPRHLYRSVFSEEAEMEGFLANICTMSWHIEHDRGVSFEDNAIALKARHPRHSALIDLWGARYADMTPGPVPGVAAHLKALKAGGIAVHGLTNMPRNVLPLLRAKFPELGLLEETVVSGDEGVLKPDARIFEVLVGRTGIDPARALFIDDSPANVEGGSAAGFHVHRFTDADALGAALRGYGLPAV